MTAGRGRRELTEAELAILPELAGKGLTQVQICAFIGIHPCTFIARRKEDPRIDELLATGRAKAIESVSNALYQAAINGNVTAQIFFLKNRSPEEWKDRRETVHTGANGGPIELTDVERTAKLAALLNAARERADRSTPH